MEGAQVRSRQSTGEEAGHCTLEGQSWIFHAQTVPLTNSGHVTGPSVGKIGHVIVEEGHSEPAMLGLFSLQVPSRQRTDPWGQVTTEGHNSKLVVQVPSGQVKSGQARSGGSTHSDWARRQTPSAHLTGNEDGHTISLGQLIAFVAQEPSFQQNG